MTDHIHKAAWAARQADRRMQDGLIETAGLPVDQEYTAEDETAEILADPDTLAAIEEGQSDLDSGDTMTMAEYAQERENITVDLGDVHDSDLDEMRDWDGVAPLEEGETELLTDDEVVEILSGTVETVNRFIEEWPELAEQVIDAERASEHPRKGIVGSE